MDGAKVTNRLCARPECVRLLRRETRPAPAQPDTICPHVAILLITSDGGLRGAIVSLALQIGVEWPNFAGHVRMGWPQRKLGSSMNSAQIHGLCFLRRRRQL